MELVDDFVREKNGFAFTRADKPAGGNSRRRVNGGEGEWCLVKVEMWAPPNEQNKSVGCFCERNLPAK